MVFSKCLLLKMTVHVIKTSACDVESRKRHWQEDNKIAFKY